MLGETSDGEFKLLRISKLDNDDVDGKPDSTVEDTPPNFSIGLWIVVRCETDIGCIIMKYKSMWCKRVLCTGSGQML